VTVRIINADVIEGLRQLPDESVHCVVTSPPYWGLRDYGVEGQIGLERTPTEFLARMVEVFREVHRVLRKDGTCWINMGDGYASSGGAGWQGKNGQRADRRFTAPNLKPEASTIGLKPKDLIGMPWRLAFALQAEGWWLRQDIIWSKPNPMPESATDRCTKAHEYIFLLTKAERYWYDADAIRTELAPKTFTTFGTNHRAQGNDALGSNKSDNWGKSVKTRQPKVKVPGGWDRGSGAHGTIHRDGRGKPEYQDLELAGANKRSVWTIATAPFPEAHFATFPTELPETCIKAGCPIGGTVLDPFSGAGTTCMVADRLQRNAIGIELNPKYAAMAERRIKGDRGELLEIMESTP